MFCCTDDLTKSLLKGILAPSILINAVRNLICTVWYTFLGVELLIQTFKNIAQLPPERSQLTYLVVNTNSSDSYWLIFSFNFANLVSEKWCLIFVSLIIGYCVFHIYWAFNVFCVFNSPFVFEVLSFFILICQMPY